MVSIARWDSLQDWQATFAQIVAAPHPEHEDTEGSWVSAHPDLCQVVHVTPDPNAGA